MDIIIRRIIDVDRRAEEIEQSTDKKIKQDREKNNSDIKTMREHMTSNAKKEGEDLYKSTINKALSEAQRIKQKADSGCMELDRKFQDIKPGIEEKAFKYIMFGQGGEVK